MSLEKNSIESIPDSLFDCFVDLKILMLSKNQLRKLTRASVFGLSGIKKLFLESNEFVEFDLNTVEYLKFIEVIVLKRNPIRNPNKLRELRVKDRMIFEVYIYI